MKRKYKTHLEQIKGKKCAWMLFRNEDNLPITFFKVPIDDMDRSPEDWEL